MGHTIPLLMRTPAGGQGACTRAAAAGGRGVMFVDERSRIRVQGGCGIGIRSI